MIISGPILYLQILNRKPSSFISSYVLDHFSFSLPVYEASHEFDKRAHRNHHPPPNPIPMPNMLNAPNSHLNPQGGPPGPPVQFNRGGPPPPKLQPNFYPGPPPPPNPHHRHHSSHPPPHGHMPGPRQRFMPPPPQSHGFLPGRGYPGPYPPPAGTQFVGSSYQRGGGRGGYHNRAGGNRGDSRPAHLPPRLDGKREPEGPGGGHREGGGANVQLNYD